jgi:hypothetical protein
MIKKIVMGSHRFYHALVVLPMYYQKQLVLPFQLEMSKKSLLLHSQNGIRPPKVPGCQVWRHIFTCHKIPVSLYFKKKGGHL